VAVLTMGPREGGNAAQLPFIHAVHTSTVRLMFAGRSLLISFGPLREVVCHAVCSLLVLDHVRFPGLEGDVALMSPCLVQKVPLHLCDAGDDPAVTDLESWEEGLEFCFYDVQLIEFS
jgi:hypothetical protein